MRSCCCCVLKSRRPAPPPSWSRTRKPRRQWRTASSSCPMAACTRRPMAANAPNGPPMSERATNPAGRIAGGRMLARWLLGAEWRSHPARAVVAIVTIALGVALGYAVQLINSAAFNEFSAAARSLSGQSDLQVSGAQPTFDESWYPRLAAQPGVALASPVLDLDVTVPGKSTSLKVLR